MRFDIVTIFPEFFSGPLDYGIVRRARESGLISINVQDLREFTHDRHRTVDDRPFGGGEGMVLKPEPLFEAVESLLGHPAPDGGETSAARPGNSAPEVPASTAVILLSASGKLFCQSTARRLTRLDRVILLCGRYEGVDERIAEHLATEELSIGDFVLSGGELPAALVIDAVTRLLPGALGNEASSLYESFSEPQDAASRSRDASAQPGTRSSSAVAFRTERMPSPQAETAQPADAQQAAHIARLPGSGASSPAEAKHLLVEFPHYTRPADFRGWQVPEVLLNGNHEEIRHWRRRMALEKTRRNRPDLLADLSVDRGEGLL